MKKKNSVIDPDLIDPCLSDKFSPNFHAWLKLTRRKHPEHPLTFFRGETDLYTGFSIGSWFMVCRVGTVLRRQANQPWPVLRQCMREWVTGGQFIPAPEVWKSYLEKGQCAFDPEHTWSYFPRTRWQEHGLTRRTCLWCGLKQKLVNRKEIIIHKEWKEA